MPAPVTYRGMSLVVPDNDSEWNEYFGLARQHKLMVRACTACGLMRYPPTHACPWCMDLGWRWQEVSGKGTIHSYEIVMHAIQPGFKELTPYAVVLVELDEQRAKPTPDEALRIIANLVKADFTPEDQAKVADRRARAGGLPGPRRPLRAAPVHAERRAAGRARLAAAGVGWRGRETGPRLHHPPTPAHFASSGLTSPIRISGRAGIDPRHRRPWATAVIYRGHAAPWWGVRSVRPHLPRLHRGAVNAIASGSRRSRSAAATRRPTREDHQRMGIAATARAVEAEAALGGSSPWRCRRTTHRPGPVRRLGFVGRQYEPAAGAVLLREKTL